MTLMRVELLTCQKQYRVTLGVLIVPETSTTAELTDLICHMLQCDERPSFVFRVSGRILHGTLGELVDKTKVSREDVCMIEYQVPDETPQIDRQISEPDWIRSVAINSRGSILTGSYDNWVRLYEAANDGNLPTIFKGSTNPVTALCWIDNDRFVAGASDGIIRIWRIDQEYPEQLLKGHEGTVQSIILQGDIIYSADFEGNIFVFSSSPDAAQFPPEPPRGNGKGKKGRQSVSNPPHPLIPVQAASKSWKAHDGTIATLLLERSGHLLSFGWDGHIRRWQMPEAFMCAAWKSPNISTANVSHDGNFFVTGHADSSIRLWNFQAVELPLLATRNGDSSGWVYAVAFDPGNNERFVSVTGASNVYMWDRRDLTEPITNLRQVVKIEGRPTKVLCLAWQGHILAYGGEDKILYTYNS